MSNNIKIIELNVEHISEKAFMQFGEIVGPQTKKPAFDQPEFSYWPGVSDIDSETDNAQLCWLEIKKPRNFNCNTLERHLVSSEGIIPLLGQSIEIFALSKDLTDPLSPPDLKSLKAFILDGTCGVNLKKGIWHWIPWPLSEKASFIVVIKKNTHEKDLQIFDLKKEYSTVVNFVL